MSKAKYITVDRAFNNPVDYYVYALNNRLYQVLMIAESASSRGEYAVTLNHPDKPIVLDVPGTAKILMVSTDIYETFAPPDDSDETTE